MDKVTFDAKTHTYHIGKKVVPSVTQIVAWKFPQTYGDVPEEILRRASEYGTRVHELCEAQVGKPLDFEALSQYDENTQKAVIDFKTLLKKYCMYPSSMEQIVSYKDLYAGTYDLFCEVDGTLIDIKTTSKIHIDNETLQAPLNLQLSLYKKAMKDVKECWYLWLPKKGVAKMGKVELWDDEDLNKLLKEYEEDNKPITD